MPEKNQIWVNAGVFDDINLPITERFSHRNLGNTGQNEVTSVSNKFVNKCFGETTDTFLEEKCSLTDHLDDDQINTSCSPTHRKSHGENY